MLLRKATQFSCFPLSGMCPWWLESDPPRPGLWQWSYGKAGKSRCHGVSWRHQTFGEGGGGGEPLNMKIHPLSWCLLQSWFPSTTAPKPWQQKASAVHWTVSFARVSLDKGGLVGGGWWGREVWIMPSTNITNWTDMKGRHFVWLDKPIAQLLTKHANPAESRCVIASCLREA